MTTPMVAALAGLVLVFSTAITGTVALLWRERDRRRLAERLTATAPQHAPLTPPGDATLTARVIGPILARLEPVAHTVPATPQLAERLVLAGIEAPGAPLLLRLGQTLGAGGGAVGGTALLLPAHPALAPILGGLGLLLGAFAPLALLDRRVARRQQRLREGLPDALDLLVVCVEAGVSLEMAIQRVSRELGRAHPALAAVLTDLSRRLSAGVPREQAFQSLHLRTGVDDLRTLATHLVQSEKWGTSLATVLRTASQDLRRRRRRAAEQRAATAATRMLAPLALCIFPTIFVVILGPAALRIMDVFRGMAR